MTYKRVIIKEFGPPEVLQLIEEPHLPEPKPGEIRVRVLTTSAAFTDTMIRKGVYPNGGLKKSLFQKRNISSCRLQIPGNLPA